MMNAVKMIGEDTVKKSVGFQARCYYLACCTTVLLAFMVPISTALTNILLFPLILFWFLSGQLLQKVRLIQENSIVRPFVGLFIVFVIGAFYSAANHSQDIIAMLNKMGKLLYFPFLLPLMQDKKWRQYGIYAFLSAMALTFILSLLKVYAKLPIDFGFATPAAIFKDHIFTNLMMAFASFILGHYICKDSYLAVRVGLIISLIGFVYYIFFMSHGRSGQVVFLSLWILFFLQKGYIRTLIYGSLALGFLFVIALDYSATLHYSIFHSLLEIFQYESGSIVDSSIGQRIQFMIHTWKLCQEHLWFGFGTGSFNTIYEPYAAANHLMKTHNPHNEYLNILFQVGLMGVIAWLSLMGIAIRKSFLLPFPERYFTQGMCVAMLVGCVANSWLMDFTSGYFFVILMAIFFGALNKKEIVKNG